MTWWENLQLGTCTATLPGLMRTARGKWAGEPAADVAAPPGQPGGGTTGAAAGTISLNSATLEQLDSLPGVGPATAQEIIAYREAQGPFTSVDQLTEVPGIGPAKLEKLRPLVGL